MFPCIIAFSLALFLETPHALQVCPTNVKPDEIVLATPVATFHNATLQVYKAVLEQHNLTVRTVTNIEHAIMYKYFTGNGGETEQCIDMVVSSDLPNNHAPWLKAFTDQYNVVGTCYELLQIFLAAPGYANMKSLTQLAASKDVNKTIIGFEIDPCARCPGLADTWIKERLPGFTYLPLSQDALRAELQHKIAAKEIFVSTWWQPSKWAGEFPTMHRLDMEEYTAQLFNQGKALIRKSSLKKFPPQALSAVGAVFLGTDVVGKLAYDAQQIGGDNAPAVVATKWIEDNRATFDMFSW